jgi:hypothetical protein
VIKEVLGAFPPGTAAGPGQFRGHATMAGHPGSCRNHCPKADPED